MTDENEPIPFPPIAYGVDAAEARKDLLNIEARATARTLAAELYEAIGHLRAVELILELWMQSSPDVKDYTPIDVASVLRGMAVTIEEGYKPRLVDDEDET